jgi:aldose 1-epimerase
MSVEAFGEVDGTAIKEVTIRSLGGAEARILTWGAVIRDLVVPARQARQRVVLGLNRIEDYVAHSPYFGAVVGRYANRIGEARFTLRGETHRDRKSVV